MITGGIMAGGYGNRLKPYAQSKALLEIDGQPLILHVLRQFHVANIATVLVETRPDDDMLVAYLRNVSLPGLAVEIIHATPGQGTASSVRAILARSEGDSLLSTVDTIAPPFSYLRLREYAESCRPIPLAAVLATSFIHDDAPIWVHRCTEVTDAITDFGKQVAPSGLCFGNVRWFSREGVNMICGDDGFNYRGDTLIMRELIQRHPGRVKLLQIDPIFDIDTEADATLAGNWLSS